MALWEIILGVLDVLCAAADVASWFKSRDNRLERREARQKRELPPARNKWGWAVTLLTPIVVLITAWILIRRW